MKIAILGFGVEGQAAFRYWSKKAAEITICDTNPNLELPAAVKGQLGPDYLKGLDVFDLLVRSPGIKPWEIEADATVTSVTREFMAKCPAPIIGVTGTKGKGTTSSLIAKILEAAGHKVWLGGNIGTPALDFLDKVKSNHWVVLELSSFQLIDVTQSPHIAVGLMIAPEHADYHRHMEEYIQAKGNIFRFQSKTDTAIYFGAQTELKRLVELSPARHIPYATPEGAYVRDEQIWYRAELIMPIKRVKLLGRHNLDNVCAAVAATHDIVEDTKALITGIESFAGLPHRLEKVRELDGVVYVDDSIATNPASALAALKAFEPPKIVILGGYDRGINPQDLVDQLSKLNVRQVLLTGDTTKRLQIACEAAGYKAYEAMTGNMQEVVTRAHQLAQPGDVVLLAPGHASFDRYKNYNDRGDQFAAAVREL